MTSAPVPATEVGALGRVQQVAPGAVRRAAGGAVLERDEQAAAVLLEPPAVERAVDRARAGTAARSAASGSRRRSRSRPVAARRPRPARSAAPSAARGRRARPGRRRAHRVVRLSAGSAGATRSRASRRACQTGARWPGRPGRGPRRTSRPRGAASRAGRASVRARTASCAPTIHGLRLGGPAAIRRSSSRLPSGVGGRSHAPSTHQVAAGFRPYGRVTRVGAALAVRPPLDDDVVPLPRQSAPPRGARGSARPAAARLSGVAVVVRTCLADHVGQQPFPARRPRQRRRALGAVGPEPGGTDHPDRRVRPLRPAGPGA